MRLSRISAPRYNGARMIDVEKVTAIDVHVHTERSQDGHDPMPAELREAAGRYFGNAFTGEALPTIASSP